MQHKKLWRWFGMDWSMGLLGILDLYFNDSASVLSGLSTCGFSRLLLPWSYFNVLQWETHINPLSSPNDNSTIVKPSFVSSASMFPPMLYLYYYIPPHNINHHPSFFHMPIKTHLSCLVWQTPASGVAELSPTR